MTTTSKLSLTHIEGTDTIAGASLTSFQGKVNDAWNRIDDRVGGVVCTSTSRPSSPYAGQMIYETDSKMFLFRNATNTTWLYVGNVAIVNSTADVTAPVNGQLVFSLTTFSMFRYLASAGTWGAYPANNVYQDEQSANGTTTSTSYTTTLTGGVACGVAFVAPPSGKVMITNQTQIATTAGAGFYGLCTPRVCTGAVVGSGTAIVTAQDKNACQLNNNAGTLITRRTLVQGLTFGDSYNVQQWFKVIGATTVTFGQKEVLVEQI
jgi:hypothetical protein